MALHDPGTFVHQVTTAHKLLFLLLLFVPFLGLWIFEPIMLVGAVPDLAINLLSAKPAQTTVFYQYTAGIIPFVVTASILGAARLRRRRRAPALLLVAASCFALVSPLDYTYVSVHERSNGEVVAVRAALKLIPPNVPVSASQTLGAYVSERRSVALFPTVGHTSWVIVGERVKRIRRRSVARCGVSGRARLGRRCSTPKASLCSNGDGKTAALAPHSAGLRHLKTKLDPRRYAAFGCLASRQLDRNFRAAVPSHPPGRDVIGDGENVQICVAEDCVNLESHQERVNRSTRAKQDALADAKLRSADQAAQPSKRGVCNLASFTNERSVLERDRRFGGHRHHFHRRTGRWAS